jgi:hypothetical protein
MSHVFTMSTLLGAAAVLAVASASQGAVLAQYDFSANPAVSSDTDLNSTATNFVASGAAAGISTSSGTAFIRSSGTGTDAAAAATDDDFFSFTVAAANSGDVLNLSSLTFNLVPSNQSTANPVNFTSNVLVSAGSTEIGTAGRTVGNTNGAPSSAGDLVSFDLSAPEFQNLGQVTLRFAFFDLQTDGNSFINRLDNVVLNGTVAAAVPEPTMLALAPLALAAMVRRRR